MRLVNSFVRTAATALVLLGDHRVRAENGCGHT